MILSTQIIGVLSTCDHASLVDKCCKYFNLMSEEYVVFPGVQHFGCISIFDLLGHAGHLDTLSKKCQLKMILLCGELLGGCRIHGNMELGRPVANRLLALQQQNWETYFLVSNIFVASDMWDEAAKVRTMMKDRL